MSDTVTLLINNIRLSPDASEQEAFSVAGVRLRSTGLKTEGVVYSIYRKSVDARKRDAVSLIYTVAAETKAPIGDKLSARLREKSIVSLVSEEPEISYGDEKLPAPPAIVGSGPCGMFAALMLAENGYRPVVIERGAAAAERKEEVSRFFRTRVLDPDTNIQFGAGGAGTFSDGKLVTRTNDPLISYVLRRFVEFGAPESILTLAKPHVGTDILLGIVDRMLARVCELGGKVMYRTRFCGVKRRDNRVLSVITDRGDIPAGALILAIGHSSRDTYEMMIKDGFSIEAKPFSVGMRIEHPTELIDRAMYGKYAGHPALGHAEYALSHNTKVRGVYTFCMCPGGEVIAATSEQGAVVTNGMSYHARSGKSSNSAVVCSVFREDYGGTPVGAIEFQRKIERAAFSAGGGDYSAPVITVGDFLSGNAPVHESEAVRPTYMNGGVRYASPENYLPGFVTGGIRAAIPAFDRAIHGFASPDALLTGAETRTSAPVRILRDNETRLCLGTDNVYPAGEGAGYAGGITSAAVDGIKTAVAVMRRYSTL